MLEKFLSVLERIAVALENGATEAGAAVEGAVKRGRGRPAKGEGVSLETLAANAANAAAASTAASAQAATNAGSPAQGGEQQLPPVQTAPTLQKVADAIIDLANTVSRDAAVKILTKYGAQKVPELKPENFAAVLLEAAAAKVAASATAGLT